VTELSGKVGGNDEKIFRLEETKEKRPRTEPSRGPTSEARGTSDDQSNARTIHEIHIE
jgi:hypothetical protein